MKITFDPEADAVYIYLHENEKLKVKRMITSDPSKGNPIVNIDLGFNNKIIGFEILDASLFVSKKVLEDADKI